MADVWLAEEVQEVLRLEGESPKLRQVCRRWALASTARINVSQVVVGVGVPTLTDAKQEPIAHFGRSLHAIGQTFSLVGGQTAEPCLSQA